MFIAIAPGGRPKNRFTHESIEELIAECILSGVSVRDILIANACVPRLRASPGGGELGLCVALHLLASAVWYSTPMPPSVCWSWYSRRS